MLFDDADKRKAALFAGLISIIVYTPTIWADFTYDDKVAVLTNPDVQQLLPVTEVFKHDFWGNNIIPTGPGQWTHHSYRPLVVLTFQLDQVLGGGIPSVFHFTNIFLHAAATVLCSSLLFSLWGSQHFILPMCASILFGLHPVHTEVVANVTSRAETVAGVVMLFGLAQLVQSMRTAPANRSSGFWLVLKHIVVPSVLAVLCKEVALVFPMVAVWVYIMQKPTRYASSGLLDYCVTKFCNCDYQIVLSVVLFTAVQYFVRIQMLSGGYSVNAAPVHNPIQFLEGAAKPLSYAYVQSLAMSMTIFPVHLSHEHNAMPPILSAWDSRNLLTLIFWGLVILILYWMHNSNQKDPMTDLPHELMFPIPYPSLRARIRQEIAAWSEDACRSYCWSQSVRCRCLIGLGIMALFYGPASHILVTVAFVLAERTLFLPTVGSVILLTELLCVLALQLHNFAANISSNSSLGTVAKNLTGNLRQELNHSPFCVLDELQPLDEVLTLEDISDLWNLLWSKVPSVHIEGKPALDANDSSSQERESICSPLVAPVARVKTDDASVKQHRSSEPVSVGVRFSDTVLKREDKREHRKLRRAQGSTITQRAGKGSRAGRKNNRATTLQDIMVKQADLRGNEHVDSSRDSSSPGQCALQSDGSAPANKTHKVVTTSKIFAVMLCFTFCAYACRLHFRAAEWHDEDILLASCLKLYPENNFMTVYGIGTRKLYNQELLESEALLLKAHNMSPTVAEPLVLLSQLYWRYGVNMTGSALEGNKKAIEYLLKVKELRKRNEFQSNLGVLQSQLAQTPEEVNAAHHAVLYAEVAHTLRQGSRMLGPVLHNACCIRLLASPSTFGSIKMAQELGERAIAVQYDDLAAGIHNLAVVHAVQGHTEQAQHYARQALSMDYSGLESATGKLLTAQAAATMHEFAKDTSESIPGEVAKQRLRALQTSCASSMLWF